MNAPPPRLLTALAATLGAAGAGAVFGAAEGARIVVAERLPMTAAEIGGLLAVAAVSGAVVSAVGAAPLWILPARPSGRARWLGFVWGLYVPVVLAIGVWWFTDPPPFTARAPLQGSVPAFVAVAAGVVAVALIVYQAARGVRMVAGAALALASALAVWVSAGASPVEPASRSAPAGAPDVLLVTLDTTRADHVGAYGYERVQTRAFDALAGGGVLFSAAAAVAPVTGPSHASLLSGRGPWDHGVLLNGVPVPADHRMLAEILHDQGWDTAAFVSAFVLDGTHGFSRGFEVYDDDFGVLPGASLLLPARALAMARRHADPDEVLERRGVDTVDAALRWLARPRQAPAFLWVHLFDAHGPYTPPPPYDTLFYQGDAHDPANHSMDGVENVAPYLERSLEGITDLAYVLAQYDGEVSYADAQLGRLLAAVDPARTLVAVIGDHGEGLGEHGEWFNHGDDVYETSVHVPFALRWPGHVPVARIDSPVEGTDLAPTLISLLGLDPEPGMTGRDLVPVLAGGEGRTNAMSMCFDRPANQADRAAGKITGPKWRMVGLRGASSRYVQREVDGTATWFDLKRDPTGVVDATSTLSGTADGAELLGLLRDQAGAVLTGDATARSAVDVSPEERARLQALGYLEQ